MAAARKDPSKNCSRVPSHGLQGRKTPLYDNCMLCDINSVPLTTCDSRKARWYLEKGLAEKITETPLRVRLLFEPSGRPLSNGYYLEQKENVCVVCGATDSYHRKNIIPREYRKHFPGIFKDHKSHDVILLCTPCHHHSTHQDSLLKTSLAFAHNAPVRSDKFQISSSLPKAKSAAKALGGAHQIPEDRRLQLLGVLKQFYREEMGGEEGENEEKLIEFVNACVDSKTLNPHFEEHGRMVVDAISIDKQGLIEFERMWRQHFLDTMMPQYLPKLWSVDHCHDVLTDL